MLLETVDVLSKLGRSMVVGTIVTLVAVAIGWYLGRYRSFPPVRLAIWWVRKVVLPLLRARTWRRRAVTIFVNNAGVLAALLALGAWPHAALIGAVFLGLSLGIAVHYLINAVDDFAAPPQSPDAGTRRSMWVGMGLNLLEPPAIVVTLGLSLGQQTIPLSLGQAWGTFVVWVVPALLIAAGGEALWMGAGKSDHRAIRVAASRDPQADLGTAPTEKSGADPIRAPDRR